MIVSPTILPCSVAASKSSSVNASGFQGQTPFFLKAFFMPGMTPSIVIASHAFFAQAMEFAGSEIAGGADDGQHRHVLRRFVADKGSLDAAHAPDLRSKKVAGMYKV